MKRSAKNKTVIIILTVVAVLAISGAAYVKIGQKSFPQETTKTQPTKDEAGPAHDPPPANATTTPQPNPSHPVTSLAIPIGPNNNTSTVSLSRATGMESVCRSVPGASCYIQASKDGQIIRVSDTKVIGSAAANDGVIFNWDAKQLSLGQWSVQAIATKDGTSAGSNPQQLTVTP